MHIKILRLIIMFVCSCHQSCLDIVVQANLTNFLQISFNGLRGRPFSGGTPACGPQRDSLGATIQTTKPVRDTSVASLLARWSDWLTNSIPLWAAI